MKRYRTTGVIGPWSLGIAALALVSLAGCGGGGSAPTPPAPPRFQPQTIQITLGSSGETVTLMTTQAGGYTRNGQAFSSGTEVTASNGSVYTLTLEGGNWRATYKVVEVSVMLGTSGTDVNISRNEDGTYAYAIGSGTAAPLRDGDIVMAANDNQYRLSLVSGEWSAAFVAPDPVVVDLGPAALGGGSVTISRNEDGSYVHAIGGGQEAPLMDGDTVTAANDNRYRLSLVGGAWTAAFVAPDAVTVALGPAAFGGGSATISRKEDGTYAYVIGSGQEAPLMDGDTVTAANDNRYRLSLVGGAWTAAFVAPDAVTVALGPAALGGGSATISRKEDGTYAYVIGSGQEAPLMDGDTVTAANDNRYRLSLVGGAWTAAFVAPDAVTVALGPAALGGGSATISRKEDGTYAYVIGSGQEAPLMDGDMVTAANDNRYRLSLVGGAWTAAFVAPDAVTVALGPAALGGGSATISRKEDGTYAYVIGSGQEAPLMDGDTVTAANDNRYRLSLVGGAWTAAFVAPDAVTVALGPAALGGGSATISRQGGAPRSRARRWDVRVRDRQRPGGSADGRGHGHGRESQPLPPEPGGWCMDGRLRRSGRGDGGAGPASIGRRKRHDLAQGGWDVRVRDRQRPGGSADGRGHGHGRESQPLPPEPGGWRMDGRFRRSGRCGAGPGPGSTGRWKRHDLAQGGWHVRVRDRQRPGGSADGRRHGHGRE